MRRFIAPFFLIFIGIAIGVGFQIATSKKEEKATRSTSSLEQRREEVAKKVADGPQLEKFSTPDGDLLTLYVPSKSMGGLTVEVKRCHVWRDAVTKTSSISCPSDSEDRTLLVGDPPEHQQ